MSSNPVHNEPTLASTNVVSGVVLERTGTYLLVQEKKPDVYGQWNLPGGRVVEGESLEEAAVREAQEEVGLTVRLGRHLHVVHQFTESPVLHAYEATITGGTLQIREHELLDAKWFTYEEIVAMKDRLRNIDYILGAIDRARA